MRDDEEVKESKETKGLKKLKLMDPIQLYSPEFGAANHARHSDHRDIRVMNVRGRANLQLAICVECGWRAESMPGLWARYNEAVRAKRLQAARERGEVV